MSDAAGLSLLYLVRHGRTALNAAGVLRGHLDPPLDAVGQQEALRLGEALGNRGALLVVSSPLRRAIQTGEAIVSRLGGEVATDPRLIDRDYGQWAGKRREEVERRWGSLDSAPGVEPLAEVRARSREALDDVARRAGGSAAVVVSHDVVIRTTLVACDPTLGDPDQVPQETGCFNVLERRGGDWSVVTVNEVPAGDELVTSETGRAFVVDDGERVDLRCSVLFFRDDAVLLCRRTDREDVWVLPGGTPRAGEPTAAAARREVYEETGIQISAERVAFVLETSSWDRAHHLIEIVFLGAERDRSVAPAQLEPSLHPSFVPLPELHKIGLRPPMAGYIRGFFARSAQPTAAYLGNLWRPDADEPAGED